MFIFIHNIQWMFSFHSINIPLSVRKHLAQTCGSIVLADMQTFHKPSIYKRLNMTTTTTSTSTTTTDYLDHVWDLLHSKADGVLYYGSDKSIVSCYGYWDINVVKPTRCVIGPHNVYLRHTLQVRQRQKHSKHIQVGTLIKSMLSKDAKIIGENWPIYPYWVLADCLFI